MKKITLALSLLLAGATMSYAQCDKKSVLTASKTEMLSADSTVQRSKDEHSEITIDKKTIVVVAADNPVMNGNIISATCNWTVPFKEGKSVYRASFTDGGETKNVTITITGKAGKLDFLALVEDEGKRIKLVVDKFEEKTN